MTEQEKNDKMVCLKKTRGLMTGQGVPFGNGFVSKAAEEKTKNRRKTCQL
ncbi:MAG: hypothetical protein LBQ97_02265 [Fusobacteriaceae bacterium]|nr:hypothetical protein [Fusobacteriaceae bacterium]